VVEYTECIAAPKCEFAVRIMGNWFCPGHVACRKGTGEPAEFSYQVSLDPAFVREKVSFPWREFRDTLRGTRVFGQVVLRRLRWRDVGFAYEASTSTARLYRNTGATLLDWPGDEVHILLMVLRASCPQPHLAKTVDDFLASLPDFSRIGFCRYFMGKSRTVALAVAPLGLKSRRTLVIRGVAEPLIRSIFKMERDTSRCAYFADGISGRKTA